MPIKTLFTDGFSITNPILKLSEFVQFLREDCGIKIYSSKRSWTSKESKNEAKRFFIRIDDKSAVITAKFLRKLAKAMTEYRKHLVQKLTTKALEEKKTRSCALTDKDIIQI